MLQLVHEQGNTLVLNLSAPLISGSQYYLLTLWSRIPIEMQGGDDVTGARTPPSKKRVSTSRQTRTFLADQLSRKGGNWVTGARTPSSGKKVSTSKQTRTSLADQLRSGTKLTQLTYPSDMQYVWRNGVRGRSEYCWVVGVELSN